MLVKSQQPCTMELSALQAKHIPLIYATIFTQNINSSVTDLFWNLNFKFLSVSTRTGRSAKRKAYLKENQTKAPQAIWLGVGMDCKTFRDTHHFLLTFLSCKLNINVWKSRKHNCEYCKVSLINKAGTRGKCIKNVTRQPFLLFIDKEQPDKALKIEAKNYFFL